MELEGIIDREPELEGEEVISKLVGSMKEESENPSEQIDLGAMEGWGEQMGDIPTATAADSHNEPGLPIFIPPTGGENIYQRKGRKSQVPGVHILLGNFNIALTLLKKQIGLINAEPLRLYFVEVYQSRNAQIQFLPQAPFLSLQINQGGLPLGPFGGTYFKAGMEQGYDLVKQGKFVDAFAFFQELLRRSVTATAASIGDEDIIKNIIEETREYITAMRIEILRRKTEV